jgi:hypothetical protein
LKKGADTAIDEQESLNDVEDTVDQNAYQIS